MQTMQPGPPQSPSPEPDFGDDADGADVQTLSSGPYTFVPVRCFLSRRQQLVPTSGAPGPAMRCARHQTATFEARYGQPLASFVPYQHAHELRLGQVVRSVEGDVHNAPPGYVRTIDRPFVSDDHYTCMAARAVALRAECTELMAELKLGCRECCLCEPVLLWERMPADYALPALDVPLAEPRTTRYAGERLVQSPQFAGLSRAERHNVLMWLFAGVRGPLTAFWHCVQDMRDTHRAPSVRAAIEAVQDRAAEFYALAQLHSDHMNAVREHHALPRLQAGQMYVHGVHRPSVRLRKTQ
jgi:hypothetical protein